KCPVAGPGANFPPIDRICVTISPLWRPKPALGSFHCLQFAGLRIHRAPKPWIRMAGTLFPALPPGRPDPWRRSYSRVACSPFRSGAGSFLLEQDQKKLQTFSVRSCEGATGAGSDGSAMDGGGGEDGAGQAAVLFLDDDGGAV